MAKKPAEKLQQTVKVKDYGSDDMNMFAVVILALEKMDERQRWATLGYVKAKWPKEWPADAI
jgi:mono/diheme cytochrome c family protein